MNLKPGQTLGYHPAGHRLIAYQLDGGWVVAVCHKDGFVHQHPEGGWSTLDFDGNHIRIPDDDITALSEMLIEAVHNPDIPWDLYPAHVAIGERALKTRNQIYREGFEDGFAEGYRAAR